MFQPIDSFNFPLAVENESITSAKTEFYRELSSEPADGARAHKPLLAARPPEQLICPSGKYKLQLSSSTTKLCHALPFLSTTLLRSFPYKEKKQHKCGFRRGQCPQFALEEASPNGCDLAVTAVQSSASPCFVLRRSPNGCDLAVTSVQSALLSK